MEKKEIVTEEAVAVAGVTIVPIAQLSLTHRQAGYGTSFFAAKEPVAIVVASPTAKRAFRITGEEISIDRLQQEFPGVTV
jgi:hypothetical protein